MVTISGCTRPIKRQEKSEHDYIPCFPKLLSENKEFVLATVFTNEESRSELRTWKLIKLTMLGLVITVALPKLLGFSDALIPNVMACILCGALLCEGRYLYSLYDTYADRIIRTALKDKNLQQKLTAAGKKFRKKYNTQNGLGSERPKFQMSNLIERQNCGTCFK